MRNAHLIKHDEKTIEEFWRLLSMGTQYKIISRQINVPCWTLFEWRQFKSRVKLNIKYAEKYGLYKNKDAA